MNQNSKKQLFYMKNHWNKNNKYNITIKKKYNTTKIRNCNTMSKQFCKWFSSQEK